MNCLLLSNNVAVILKDMIDFTIKTYVFIAIIIIIIVGFFLLSVKTRFEEKYKATLPVAIIVLIILLAATALLCCNDINNYKKEVKSIQQLADDFSIKNNYWEEIDIKPYQLNIPDNRTLFITDSSKKGESITIGFISNKGEYQIVNINILDTIIILESSRTNSEINFEFNNWKQKKSNLQDYFDNYLEKVTVKVNEEGYRRLFTTK